MRTAEEAKKEALHSISLGYWEEALPFCLVHYKLEPKDAHMCFWLARCYDEVGKPNEAAKYWKEANLVRDSRTFRLTILEPR